jgi:hypothetical protein
VLRGNGHLVVAGLREAQNALRSSFVFAAASRMSVLPGASMAPVRAQTRQRVGAEYAVDPSEKLGFLAGGYSRYGRRVCDRCCNVVKT